ncbi:haspin like kinase domain-containing protein [Ditylenchus destructor]|uniref:non-specific serine/threonine protein kinase n=1 Tax=Ditylenchus destructor TaxID=166010 RepID=A0AAD4MH21_9BILA|nr:haspin like kinase domain-containing protein [Ditylenchus destructor]
MGPKLVRIEVDRRDVNLEQDCGRICLKLHNALHEAPKMTRAAREKLAQFVPEAEPIIALDQADAHLPMTTLDELLLMCQQDAVGSWDPFIEQGTKWAKIAEGSYGDVYAALFDGVRRIIKVVPIRDPADEPEERLFGASQMLTVSAVAPEVATGMALSALDVKDKEKTRALGAFSCPSFVKVAAARVLRGGYPAALLEAFGKFKAADGPVPSDDDEPKEYENALNPWPAEYESEEGAQLYLIQVLEDAGKELEKWLAEFNPHLSPKKAGITKSNMRLAQCGSLFFQCAIALAIAEEKLEFEHRDAHESNLMVRLTSAKDEVRFVFNGNTIKLKSCGVVLTLIDYTHSRVKTEQGLFYTNMGQQSIFDGSGRQTKVYKDMRDINGNSWAEFNPQTNVLWLEYLAELLFDGFRDLRQAILAHLEGKKRIKLFLAEPKVQDILYNYLL